MDLVDEFIDSPRLVMLVVLLIANYFAAYVLVRESRERPGILSLSERARAAVILAVVATFSVILFAELRIVAFTLPPEVAQWVSFGVSASISIPAVYWLYLYYRRKWR